MVSNLPPASHDSAPMQKIKLTIALVAVVLALIVVLQNTESVETRILFAKISMPRALLLVATTAVGFLGGVVFSSLSRGRRDSD